VRWSLPSAAAERGRKTTRRSTGGHGAFFRAAADALIAEYGRIDFLVNSTSISVFGDFLTLTDEDWLKVFNAKHLGYVRTLRAALPHMIAQKFGRVLNVSGRGGQHPSRIHLPGGSANAAVDLLTKGLSKVYAEHNIRVNAVSPGADLFAAAGGDAGSRSSEDRAGSGRRLS
jgi:NAD(P)-dependent dehydrogenase (short-subunit alcohol dehydrogenase family)